MKKIKVLSLLVLSMCLLVFSTKINAATEVVANNVSEVVSLAQAATDDTTIKLSSNFSENMSDEANIVINNDVAITIDGSNGPNGLTKLNAATTKAHFIIENLSTKAFTIKNINFIGDTVTEIRANRSGGLRIKGSEFVLMNTDFISNYAAVFLNDTTQILSVKDSAFTSNYFNYGAGAISAERGLINLNTDNVTFTNNIGSGSGYSGGAIWTKLGHNMTIKNSSFVSNISDGTGGGGAIAITIGNATGKIDIDKSYFKDNRADTHPSVYSSGSAWSDGGAIYTWTLGANQEFNLSNSVFDGNYAQDDGGALMLERLSSGNENTPTKVINNTFINNNAAGKGIAAPVQNGGGAIQVSQKTNVLIENNTIIKNNAGGIGESQAAKGGAIATYSAGQQPKLTLNNNIILANTITDNTGNIINSDYNNIEASDLVQANNIGIDNGTPLPNNINLLNTFGTNTPTLQTNFSITKTGDDNLNTLMSIPIIPTGLADNKGIATSSTTDTRGYLKATTPDIGAVEMLSVKYDANGGQWTNLPTLNFTGQEYYADTTTDNYYSLAYKQATISALDSDNLSNTGKIFKGWSTSPTGAVEVNPNDSILLTNDKVLYAVWDNYATPPESSTLTVKFDSLGGSKVKDITNIISGSTISEPGKPTYKDHTFMGWYQEKSFTNKWDFKTNKVTTNKTLYAKWQKNKLPESGNNLFTILLMTLSITGISIITIRKYI